MCADCPTNRNIACQFDKTLGVQRDGGLAEYISVPVEKLYTARLGLREQSGDPSPADQLLGNLRVPSFLRDGRNPSPQFRQRELSRKGALLRRGSRLHTILR